MWWQARCTHRDGIWFAGARPPVSFPESARDELNRVEEQSFWFRHRNRCILAALRRYPPGGPLVDVGGGNGYVSIALQANGFPVVLVEPGEAGARHAQARGVATVVCATLQQSGVPDASLGAVGLFDVIEHVEHDEDFLREIHGKLRPAGRLYLTVPALPALWSRDDKVAGHHRRYTPRGLAALVERIGFRVETVSCMFSWLPPLIYVARTLPSLLQGSRDDFPDPAGQHLSGAPWRRLLAERLLAFEARRIADGRRVNFGSSVILVAKKA